MSGFCLTFLGSRFPRFQVSGFLGFRFQVSGFRFLISDFRFLVAGFRLGVEGDRSIGSRIAKIGSSAGSYRFELRVRIQGFRGSSFRFQVSGCRLQLRVFGLGDYAVRDICE